MKIVMLSISFEGGAGGAAYRLHRGLLDTGVSSHALVQTKIDGDHVVSASKGGLSGEFDKLRPKLDRLPLRFYPRRGFFSAQWFPDNISSKVKELNPDLINLHWVCNGFVRIETIPQLNKPIVWSLHDMWPFTGGCFHTNDCDRYINSCGSCPQLSSKKDKDLSRWVWNRKARAWNDLDLTIVTPSSWLAECARSSSLFKNKRVEIIPHGLNIETFKPGDRQLARNMLNLPQDKKLVLFGTWINSHLKGFHLLQSALQELSEGDWGDKLELVVFGLSHPPNQIDLGIKSHYLGRFQDELSMALVYSAADVMVVPSLHESFGLTAAEALACGTPVVAFNMTGLKDVVDHQQNGYLAKPFEVKDLTQGIIWVLEDNERYEQLSYQARKKAEQAFALEVQVQRYSQLFDDVIKNYKR